MSCWLPSYDEVVEVHDFILCNYGGGLPGIKDENLVQSAVTSPQQPWYEDVIAKAAALGFLLAANHGFHDGNKRTAVTCLETVLERNGWILCESDESLYDLVVAVAEHRMDREQFTARVRTRCRIRLDASP